MATVDEIREIAKGVGTTAQTVANNLRNDDGRLTQADANSIKTQGEADANASNQMYDDMITQNNTLQDQTLDMIATNEASQKEIANANTDFAIDKIEQQKSQTHKDYIKEQSGAYADWQKQSDQYGANAEAMAANGLANTGYSESSQVAMYVAYQNRVAVARESYQRAIVDYNNAITEARLQNNSMLAEIAAQALEKRMEAIVTFTQQGNALLTQKADAAYKIKQTAHSNWMDVLKTIEQQRQFDISFAEQQRQHDDEMSYKNASLAEQQRQFNEEMAYKNAQANKTSGSYSSDKEDQFTGTTYKDATVYMMQNGVDKTKISSLMTQSEWQRHKNSSSNSAHVKYDSYAEYLKAYIEYATGK